MTMLGLNQTPRYRLPPMPWGLNRDEVEPTLKRWNARLASVEFLYYRSPRGTSLLFARAGGSVPFLRHVVPSLVHVTISEAVCQLSVPDAEAARSTEPAPYEECDLEIKATLGDVFAAAKRKSGQDRDLLIAAGNVIARRVALGMACALDPLRADRDEFAGIVPEKVEAFSDASMIMLDRSADASRQLSRLAYDEAMATTRATIAIATCANPAALAAAQASFLLGWFDRASSNFAAMGMLALSAQNAAIAPISQSVHANVERLNSGIRH
jgi:hypothetical protein